MNRELLSKAVGGIDDLYIAEACIPVPEDTSCTSERIVHMKTKRILTLALAAALILALGAAAFGAADWFTETRSLGESTELQQQADRGAEDLHRFTGGGSFVADDDALYEDGNRGQSDTTMYFYNNREYVIAYYGSGEIHVLDASASYKLECPSYMYAVDYLEEQYPDAAAYKTRVEAAAPGILDTLHEDGWVVGDSSEIERVYCSEHNRFDNESAVCRILMIDGSSYELLLQPDTLDVEGFLYWKAEDTPNARNGFFTALHEGSEEEWWSQLQSGALG